LRWEFAVERERLALEIRLTRGDQMANAVFSPGLSKAAGAQRIASMQHHEIVVVA
jgi:hypothetical protein